jgi:uncharacterized protein YlxW (UPF0749 family)
MDGGQLTAVIIVAIIMVASIIKVAMRGPNHHRRMGFVDNQAQGQTQAENQRLRDEVSQLKERLKVLERITVDKENSLSREIDSLRDR